MCEAVRYRGGVLGEEERNQHRQSAEAQCEDQGDQDFRYQIQVVILCDLKQFSRQFLVLLQRNCLVVERDIWMDPGGWL